MATTGEGVPARFSELVACMGPWPAARQWLGDTMHQWSEFSVAENDLERYCAAPRLLTPAIADAIADCVLGHTSRASDWRWSPWAYAPFDGAERASIRAAARALGRAAASEIGYREGVPPEMVPRAVDAIRRLFRTLTPADVERVTGALGRSPASLASLAEGPADDYEAHNPPREACRRFDDDDRWMVDCVEFAAAAFDAFAERGASSEERAPALEVGKLISGVSWIAEYFGEVTEADEPAPAPSSAEHGELSEEQLRVLARSSAAEKLGHKNFWRTPTGIHLEEQARSCRRAPDQLLVDLFEMALRMAQAGRSTPQTVRLRRQWVKGADNKKALVVPALDLDAADYREWLGVRARALLPQLLMTDAVLGSRTRIKERAKEIPTSPTALPEGDVSPRPVSGRPGVAVERTGDYDPDLSDQVARDVEAARERIEDARAIVSNSERELMDAYLELSKRLGREPTWREVAFFLGKTEGAVNQIVHRLKRRKLGGASAA